MTKEEMKNRISMALKDPILQQWFECICKENAELKTKKIPQLERKIASIRGCHSVDAKKLNARIEQVERLKKENAELLCQKNRNKSCYSCANATERCFRNEIGCPCQKYKSYTEENAELKKKILDTQDAVTMQMYTNKANKEIADRQLTKAKELLNEFMRISKASDEDFEHDFSELIGEAEQFLKEVKE